MYCLSLCYFSLCICTSNSFIFLFLCLFRYTLKESHLKKPTLDVRTRWSSTYMMLENLLYCKDFCRRGSKDIAFLSLNRWNQIEDLVAVLQSLNTATLQLQKQQLFFGDFYKLWLEMKLQLKAVENELSPIILNYVEKRETKLLDIPTISAALFLDPRLRRLLRREKREKAKLHLKKIAIQMESINIVEKILQQPTTSTSQSFGELPVFDESSNQSTSSLLRQNINNL